MNYLLMPVIGIADRVSSIVGEHTSVEPGSSAPRQVPAAANLGRILVVEDEVLIRLMVSDDLRDAGYDAIEACNADEAIAILESRIAIDLVITDVRMPGSLDGLGLLALIRARSSRLPVIVMSGHLEPRMALIGGATQFLAKPFRMKLLIEAVQAELGRDL